MTHLGFFFIIYYQVCNAFFLLTCSTEDFGLYLQLGPHFSPITPSSSSPSWLLSVESLHWLSSRVAREMLPCLRVNLTAVRHSSIRCRGTWRADTQVGEGHYIYTLTSHCIYCLAETSHLRILTFLPIINALLCHSISHKSSKNTIWPHVKHVLCVLQSGVVKVSLHGHLCPW